MPGMPHISHASGFSTRKAAVPMEFDPKHREPKNPVFAAWAKVEIKFWAVHETYYGQKKIVCI
jgi:hypothetical protein